METNHIDNDEQIPPSNSEEEKLNIITKDDN